MRKFAILAFLFAKSAMAQVGSTAPTCIWSGSVASCLPSSGVYLPNQRALRLGELNSNGTDYAAIRAPASFTTYTLTLPADDGNVGEALTTNGSGTLSWTVINPTTTTGDLIYSSTTTTPGTLARLATGASGTVLHGGATPSYSQIVNADVDPAAAIAGTKIVAAGAATTGVVNTAAQSFGGLKSFPDGLNSAFSVSRVVLRASNGRGSSNTNVMRFTTTVDNVGSDITYADSATDGASFTINTTGLYFVAVSVTSASAVDLGITKNSTGDPGGLNYGSALLAFTDGVAGTPSSCAGVAYLVATDIVRVNVNTVTFGTNGFTGFRIIKIF